MESSGASSLEAIVQQPGGVVRLHLAWFHRLWVCRSAFDIRQETRDYPQQGQQGADPKDEFDAGLVGQPAEEGRAEAAEAEHQPEKDPGDHPDLAGHQVGGVDQDGGECRGDDESDDDGERDRAGQVRIGQQQGEGRSPEDGAPDHVFTPETVAQRPAGDRADSRCPEECEEAVLRPLHRDPEFIHQEECEVVGHAGDVKVFREYQHAQDAQGEADFAFSQVVCRGRCGCCGVVCGDGEAKFIPVPDSREDEDGEDRGQSEPADRGLPEGNDDQRGQQRPHGAPGVAADLEYRLCQSFPASRSELRHPGGFGVEDRRAAADQPYRQQEGYEARGDGEGEQPEQREAHPRGERVGARMAVCIESDEGLQQRRGHLENQRDDSDLGEREAEFLLQERVDGRDHRLHHVVQQVGDADHEQYRVDCSGLREAPQACVRGFCKRLHCCGLWFFEYPRDRLPGIPHVPGKDVSE